MKNQFKFVVAFTLLLIAGIIKAQTFSVFTRTNNLPSSPIYQAYAGLFGVGFTSTSNISSQLSITNANSSIPLLSLYRGGTNFFLDFDGNIAKFGKLAATPGIAINSTTKNVYIGSTEYSSPSKLNIKVDFNSSTDKTCVYSVLNTFNTSEIGFGYYLSLTGPGANSSNALFVSNSNFSEPRVFNVRGDGTTEIGGASYNGIYGSAKLSVNGLIAAKEIIVNATSWADFVFDNDYNLMSIDNVDKYIKTNGHLPDIPDYKSVTSNGYSVGNMDKILLQKIEELTLYIIDLKKEIDNMKTEKK